MRRVRLRSTVRALRDTRALGWVISSADRVWWWRVIRRSGLTDSAFYAAQLGVRRILPALAIAHYVVHGFRRGLSLNPFFDEITAGGHLPEVFRVPAMYAYLLSEKETVAIHPLWDAPEHARRLGIDSSGALEHLWSHPDAELELTIGGATSRCTVRQLRAAALAAARSWRPLANAGLDRGGGDESDLTLLRIVQKRDRRYGLKLEQAVRFASRAGASVVVDLVSPDASQWIVARLVSLVAPGVRVIGHTSRSRWQDAVDEAAALCPAGVLIVLDARAEFADEDVDALATVAGRGFASAPAHRNQNGTLVAAGAGRVRGRLYRLLSDHPVEDLAGWGEDPVNVPLLAGRTFAAPVGVVRDALRDLHGFRRREDVLEAITDVAHARGTPSMVLPTITPVLEEPEYAFADTRSGNSLSLLTARDDTERIHELLSSACFEVEEWRAHPSGLAEPRLRWRRPAPGAQRWALKICAPPGRAGAVWGDTHFALGLARALRRRGHDVVIDAFGAARRGSAYLDDVSVVIRGPYRIVPPDTGVRLEWIISHPDDITAREVADFDRVFAASRRWARAASERFRAHIEPLLECTDVDQFHPSGLPRGEDIVFVGTARGIARPSVVAPLAAGIDVKVYGPDWRPFIPASAVVAQSIRNADLPARYETASIVLNDQWPAMREQGFIAMRPFDAVAVRGRVISESVDEIEDIFQGAVVAYRDAEDLVRLLRTDPATLFPGEEELSRIAAYVREHHSFDARADVLAEAVEQQVRDSAPVDSPRHYRPE